EALWRYDAKRCVLGPEALPSACRIGDLLPRNGACRRQPCRQPVCRNDSGRACWPRDMRAPVGPCDRPLPFSDVNNVVRPVAQSIGQRKEEGELAGGVASEPGNQALVRRFEALPECFEI